MFLTRMPLNGGRRSTAALLSSPQRMHAKVLSCFPPEAVHANESGRVLWRVDRAGHEVTLYVSSPEPPDLQSLVEEAGWATSSAPWSTGRLAPLFDRLEAGQRWQFRLTANPVISRKGQGSRRGKPIPLKDTDQEAWLMERAPRTGFQIPVNSLGAPELIVSQRRRVAFSKRIERPGQGAEARRSVALSMATYDGILEVVDPDLLRRTMGHGLGRGRAYGCGLITLACSQ